MNDVAEEFARAVFIRSDHIDMASQVLDLSLSNVLWALDGIKTLDDVAREDGYDIHNLIKRVEQLLDLGLIKRVGAQDLSVAQEIIPELIQQLSNAIGPIADILAEDTALGMGCDLNDFPVHQLNRFIDLLSKEIQQKEKADVFVENMMAYLGKASKGK